MDEYHVIKYTSEKRKEWDNFVEVSNNGTIFHRQDFLSYHPPNRFLRDDKMIYRGGELMGLFPLSYHITKKGKIGRSPYGASFGGIVTREIRSKHAEQVTAALISSLAKDGYSEIEVCFPPDCYYKSYNNSIEYTLLKKVKYQLVDRGLTSVIELTGTRKLSKNFVRNLSKAEKAKIKVIMPKEVYRFYDILRETVISKHGGQLTHTLEELKYLKKNLNDMVKIFLGIWEGRAISGVLIFENASPCAFAFYNCHLQEFSHLCSLHKVFDYIIGYCGKSKKWLDLGLTDRF
ncbi:MAG: hypothetical protein ACFE8U_17940, partial [Candidatus Hermodarchaeota archaeon]